MLNSNYGPLKTIWCWKRLVFPRVTKISNKIAIFINNYGRRNEFQSEALMEHWEVVLLPWLVVKKRFLSSSRSITAIKQWYFNLGDSFLIVTVLKLFLFSVCLPFFFFATQENGGTVIPGVANLKFWKCWKCIYQVKFLVVKSINGLNPYQVMSFSLSQCFFYW